MRCSGCSRSSATTPSGNGALHGGSACRGSCCSRGSLPCRPRAPGAPTRCRSATSGKSKPGGAARRAVRTTLPADEHVGREDVELVVEGVAALHAQFLTVVVAADAVLRDGLRDTVDVARRIHHLVAVAAAAASAAQVEGLRIGAYHLVDRGLDTSQEGLRLHAAVLVEGPRGKRARAPATIPGCRVGRRR